MNVARLSVDGKMMNASKFGAADDAREAIELTEAEKAMEADLRETWKAILNIEIQDDTDFFKAGAGSMDVVRFVLIITTFMMNAICINGHHEP